MENGTWKYSRGPKSNNELQSTKDPGYFFHRMIVNQLCWISNDDGTQNKVSDSLENTKIHQTVKNKIIFF